MAKHMCFCAGLPFSLASRQRPWLMTACRGSTEKQNTHWRRWAHWRSPTSHLGKMVALAINGITSLSVRPIRMIALMGIILFVVFLAMSVWVFGTWVAGQTVQGWTSVMLLFLLIPSFQTFAIAVIGEYDGKIYFETKARPRYIVEEEIGVVPVMPDNETVRNRTEAMQ